MTKRKTKKKRSTGRKRTGTKKRRTKKKRRARASFTTKGIPWPEAEQPKRRLIVVLR